MKTILSILTLVYVYGTAQAQAPLFQQINSRPKGLTNIAEPIQVFDSFLGQDKQGPYILTWNKFIYAPGYPVIVSIDGSVLKTTEYSINIDKGEITFNSVVKRTQIVNVKYNYYPEVSNKNANPSLTNPFTIKLASNSFSGLTLTAMNPSNLATAPSMVFGHTYNTRGLSTNYYANPTGKGLELQDAMRLGYSLGNNNSLTANYEKSNKGFSGFAKNFGMIESGEKSSLVGKYSLASNTNLSFNNSNFRSLNSVVENNSTAVAFNLTGKGRQPSFNYSINDVDSVDAKNNKVASTIQSSNFNSQLGQGALQYKNVSNDVTSNGVRTVNNSEVLSYGDKQLKAARTQEFKIDPKLGTISSTTDNLSYATKILGGSASIAATQTDSIINNKSVQNDQFNYNLNFKGNSKGFSGITLFRTENNNSSGSNQVITTSDKISFGFKNVNYSANNVVNQIGDNVRKDVIDNSLSVSLPTRKNLPTLSFSSVDAIRRNDKGVLVGSSNDSTIFKHQISSFQFGYRFGQITTFAPDGNVTSIDNSTGNVIAKIGKGSFVTESANNQILNGSNRPINQEINKFNYSLAPNKNMPGFELERIDTNSTQDTNNTSVTSDKLKLVSKVGSTSVNAATSLSITDTNSRQQNEVKNNVVSLSTPIWGPSSSLSVNLNSNVNLVPTGEETKTGVGINLTPAKNLTVSTEQADTRFISNAGSIVNYSTNNKFGVSLNLSGALLQTSVNTLETNTSRSDVYDYRTVIGNDKTFFKVDSSVRMRESTLTDINLNKDSTQTSINLNTSRNFKVSGSYLLNPDDPTKPGQTIPMEKRTLGMNMRFGRIDLNGSYSSLEHLPGTPIDVISKAGGYNILGESGIKLGYKSGSTSLYSEYRDQVFYGTNFKGISTYTVGFTQTKGDRFNFTLNGTVTQNKNNSSFSQDYRAEAKIGVKF